MCWNAEVSIQSFFIGLTAIVAAYQKGLPLPTALFCLTIVGMQLVEYVVWTFWGNQEVNFAASIFAATLLFLQPIASILTVPSKHVLALLQAYFGVSFLTLFLRDGPMRERYRMSRGENGHLVWNWLQKDWKTAVSLSIYFVFLLGPLLFNQAWTLLTVTLLTLGLSLYSYYKDNTWGSMWCWIVNYIVVGVCVKQVLVPKP